MSSPRPEASKPKILSQLVTDVPQQPATAMTQLWPNPPTPKTQHTTKERPQKQRSPHAKTMTLRSLPTAAISCVLRLLLS